MTAVCCHPGCHDDPVVSALLKAGDETVGGTEYCRKHAEKRGLDFEAENAGNSE